MKKFILLAALLACGGEDVSSTSRGVLTGDFTPTGNGTPQNWTAVGGSGFQTVDDYPTLNPADYLQSDKSEDHASTIPLSATAPVGSLVTEFQITVHAARVSSFPGNCLLRVGYRLDGENVTFGTQVNVTAVSPSYGAVQRNFGAPSLVPRVVGSQVLSLVIRDDGGEDCRVAWKKVKVRYVPVPSNFTIADQVLSPDGQTVTSYLSWSDVTDESGYRIEYSVNNGSTWQQAANPGANVTSAVHAASPVGTAAIRYRIRAKSGTEVTAPSAYVAGLAQPGALSIGRSGATGAIFLWSDTDPTNEWYQIYRGDRDGNWGPYSPILSGSATSWLVNPAEPGYYYVAAFSDYRVSRGSHKTYVPPPAFDWDNTWMLPDGGFDYEPVGGYDGTAINTDIATSLTMQPFLDDPYVSCVIEYSTNGLGGPWFIAEYDCNMDGDIQVPGQNGLIYRARTWWSPTDYSAFEYLEGIPAPLGFSLTLNGFGGTTAAWQLNDADWYDLYCIDNGVWALYGSTMNSYETLSGTWSRTCHVFSLIQTPGQGWIWSVASTNVTGP